MKTKIRQEQENNEIEERGDEYETSDFEKQLILAAHKLNICPRESF